MDLTADNSRSAADGPARLNLLTAVKPYIAVAAVVVTGSVLVAAIYYTLLDLAWIAFLGGILVASILAMSTQAARVEITSAERAGKLTLAEYLLRNETILREAAELKLADSENHLKYSDKMLPAMLAFVDTNTRYEYHNRAFRNWVGLQHDRIDGQHMRDVLGRTVFKEIEPYVIEAASGRTVCYERIQVKADGRRVRLAVQLLPQAGGDGKPGGFHVVMSDITGWQDDARIEPPKILPLDEPAESTEAWRKASNRVLAAINGDEFALYCQRIAAVTKGVRAPDYHEVLIRLREEESGHVPPGAFFSLAEEYGLMPQLDRWVFEHVLEWLVSPVGAQTALAGEMYFINVHPSTLGDPGFPDFVELHLRLTGASGDSVCIEIAEADLVLHQGDAVAFARKIRALGCRIAISGFGHNRLAMRVLRLMQVDFLKIDGSIVRHVATYPVQLGKVVAITRIAKSIGARTVAEMVEDSHTLGMLDDAGVDFAQGFGIALPKPLEGIVPFSTMALASAPLVPDEPRPSRKAVAGE